jgi:hypothetical protein
LVAAVEAGRLSISAAARRASRGTEAQPLAASEGAAERPVAQVRPAAGVEEREPLHLKGEIPPALSIVDARGCPVPPGVMVPFQTAQTIKMLCGQLDALGGQLQQLVRRPGSELIALQAVLPHLIQARKALWEAQPVEVCSWCSGHGSGCHACRGRGWFPVNAMPGLG